MLGDQKIEAQEVLEELYSQRLLPFKLFAYQVKPLNDNEYIVRFHDSRLHSVNVSWQPGRSFKDEFRSVVLERIKRMSALSNKQ